MQQGVVPLCDGIQHQASDPRQAEELLHYDRPAHEKAELDPDDGHYGDHSVLDRVARYNG